MPTYEYGCSECALHFELFLPMSESSVPQPCPTCGQPGERLLSLPSFVLKGDGWASKNIRIKGQMAKKNARLDQKMRDHAAPSLPGMTPNVGGEQTASWSDAQRIASTQGKDASSYEPLVQREKRGTP